eukprot:COSAG06_NODE_5043_length_3765_cov_7.691489_3_plen_99_part_00
MLARSALDQQCPDHFPVMKLPPGITSPGGDPGQVEFTSKLVHDSARRVAGPRAKFAALPFLRRPEPVGPIRPPCCPLPRLRLAREPAPPKLDFSQASL